MVSGTSALNRKMSTAGALRLLHDQNIYLIVGGKRINSAKRLRLVGHAALVRALADPIMFEKYPLKAKAIDLDKLSVDRLDEQLRRGIGLSRTRWLAEKIVDEGSSGKLATIVSDRGEMAKELAIELLRSGSGLAEETVAISPEQAVALTKERVGDFLTLANLSDANPGDADYADFIINIVIKANRRNYEPSPIHFGVVTFYAAAIANELDINIRDPQMFQWLKTAALLHDAARITISNELLKKSGLTEPELAIMRNHLPLTVHLLRQIKWLKNTIEILKHHHDDKDGYQAWLKEWPAGAGDSLRLSAMILLVADSFDGMTSDRDYKKPGVSLEMRNGEEHKVQIYSPVEAITELRTKLKGQRYAEEAIGALEKVIANADAYLGKLQILFRPKELELVWFGIEHLIKKELFPATEAEESEWRNSYLRKNRPLLWLISGAEGKWQSSSSFIDNSKAEIKCRAEKLGLALVLDEFIRRHEESLSGPFYLLLYRALKVDEKFGTDTFRILLKKIGQSSSDVVTLAGIIYNFKFINHDFCDNYRNWLVASLLKYDTWDIPEVGEKAFIETVDNL
ncbi:MAG: HD domain-containing protein [Candidatus Margulisbacteria bacterium]|nr:HD domain-containing protein [Candidatus Margulisiibacteriota bacterium]